MSSRQPELSAHAELRSQQRSIPEIGIWLLRDFGRREHAGDGSSKYSFDKKAWKEVERFMGSWHISKMDQLRKAYIIVSSEDRVITAAYREGH